MEGEIKMDNKIHWYELCFYGDEDTESEKYVADKACSYVIKTEIKPVIDNKVALKILFGENPIEDEASFFDIEGLTKRVENEYGVYYTRE